MDEISGTVTGSVPIMRFGLTRLKLATVLATTLQIRNFYLSSLSAGVPYTVKHLQRIESDIFVFME